MVAHNVRSCHNVGSMLRTADGMGIKKVYLTGYTPYPKKPNDPRLPHLANKINRQITKTSLGAEKFVSWAQFENLEQAVKELKADGFAIVALEQTKISRKLNKSSFPERVAILVGNEIEGLMQDDIKLADLAVEIPMLGNKESFNVAAAAAMALHHLRYS